MLDFLSTRNVFLSDFDGIAPEATVRLQNILLLGEGPVRFMHVHMPHKLGLLGLIIDKGDKLQPRTKTLAHCDRLCLVVQSFLDDLDRDGIGSG